MAQGGRWPVIAIDGGAGTGKTTGAALVAERLGFCYVDSGAVYRAIGFALSRTAADAGHSGDSGLTAVDPDALLRLPLSIRAERDCFRVFLNGRELDAELRTPEITSLASRLAVLPAVRERVRGLLREAAESGPLVVEGRDIGTVVFPEAELKVFLIADLRVRASRRRLDLLRAGRDVPLEDVARDLAERDERDSTRRDSPLRKAEDAVLIDTSDLTLEEQVQAVLEAYHQVRDTRDPQSRPHG